MFRSSVKNLLDRAFIWTVHWIRIVRYFWSHFNLQFTLCTINGWLMFVYLTPCIYNFWSVTRVVSSGLLSSIKQSFILGSRRFLAILIMYFYALMCVKLVCSSTSRTIYFPTYESDIFLFLRKRVEWGAFYSSPECVSLCACVSVGRSPAGWN